MSWVSEMNELGRAQTPFFFLLDFELQKPEIIPLHGLSPSDIKYEWNGISNVESRPAFADLSLKQPFPLEQYKKGFNTVYHHLQQGDSYLLNYTVRHQVNLSSPLEEVFYASHAPYKLWHRHHGFVCFSPEIFVKMSGQQIATYPMKGTIDANLPNARETLLADQKELAEHVTVADLLRNDLSRVARQVNVTRFRYVDLIESARSKIYQVSSEIVGALPIDWKARLGDIFQQLLPAGSISGAPKAKTCEIIREIEGSPRGFYCGVAGIFDGHTVDSAVLIRFIEQQGDQYFYRSGGGITLGSNVEREYQETLTKVYVPVV